VGVVVAVNDEDVPGSEEGMVSIKKRT